MYRNRTRRIFSVIAVAACGSGMLLGAGCTSAEVRAVVAGLEAVASSLSEGRDDDISFTDWLINELED